jgi:uncharacterized protein YkwD
MYCLLAAVRQGAGMGVLQPATELGRSAGLKARRIRACQWFTHNPCGDPLTVPFRRVRLGRYGAWLVGETLAWQPYGEGNPRSILEAWLASPTHRAVLLDARFTNVGVRLRRAALRDAPSGVVVWVAHLGAPIRTKAAMPSCDLCG